MTPISAASSSLGAVVVTYFPDAAFGARLAAIAREYQPILVVDNSADASIHARLTVLCRDHRCTFIPQTENVGLATALNRGFAALSATGAIHAVAFDQDSTPSSGHAAALLGLADSAPRPAIVGSNWHDEARPAHPSRHLRRHPLIPLLFQRPIALADLDRITSVITSGTLFDLAAWRELGGFDESLFLDLVDTEYCLRARAAGYHIAVAAAARLAHNRGAKRPVCFLGRTFWPAFMPPLRLRYLFRNRLLVAQVFAIHAPHWLAFELAYTAKIISEILALESQKLAKLRACARGTWDGLFGARGRIS